MIIKFKTRKNIYSAKQLVSYILTDKGKIQNPFEAPIILQNINRLELQTMHKDFLDNYKYQPTRKGSTAMYHEILAISKNDREFVTKKMLQDMIENYIQFRGLQNSLVIAKSHDMQHIHFMISSNELRSKKRLRMSHKEMKKLLLDFELWHKEKYPQLVNSIVHTVKKPQIYRDIAKEDRNHRREKLYQMKMRNPSKISQKELVSQRVKLLMQEVGNFAQLKAFITQDDDLEIYSYRGKIRGVLYKERKYRFSTLQVTKEKLLQLSNHQKRLEELSLIKEMHKATRDKQMELGRKGF